LEIELSSYVPVTENYCFAYMCFGWSLLGMSCRYPSQLTRHSTMVAVHEQTLPNNMACITVAVTQGWQLLVS